MSLYYGRGESAASVISIIGILLALAGTICLFIMVLPEKARAKLPPFMKYIHDFFNFKVLWLEKILKFLYTFTTLLSIVCGLLMFIVGPFYDSDMMVSGLLVMLLGPVAIRIVYESIMLFIILVRNSNQINRKLGQDKEEEKRDYSAPVRPVQQPVYSSQFVPASQKVAEPEATVFCPFCGQKQSAENNNCIQCGERIKDL